MSVFEILEVLGLASILVSVGYWVGQITQRIQVIEQRHGWVCSRLDALENAKAPDREPKP